MIHNAWMQFVVEIVYANEFREIRSSRRMNP